MKKVYYDAKISDIESKYSTTSDYNKFMNKILNAKINEKILVNKLGISGFTDNSDLDKKDSNINNKSRINTRTK